MKTLSTLRIPLLLLLLLMERLAARPVPGASSRTLQARPLAAAQDARPNKHVSVWEPTLDTTLGTSPSQVPSSGGSTTVGLTYGDNGLIGLVSIGTPPQVFRMFISTSSVFWVSNYNCSPNARYYNHSLSSSYTANGTEFNDGFFRGFISQDTVTIGDFAIPNQGFAEITHFMIGGEPTGVDGMLGFGFETNDPDSPSMLPFHSLVASGVLDEPLFALSIHPLSSNGVLTIGATDPRRYTGDIVYADVVDPRSWTVEIDAIHVNGESMTTLRRAEIAPELSAIFGPEAEVAAFAKAVDAHPVNEFWYGINCTTPGPDIVIQIAGAQFVLTKRDYTHRNAVGDNCTFAIMGMAYDRWMFGLPFMQNVYTVFKWGDVNHAGRGRKVGFAVSA